MSSGNGNNNKHYVPVNYVNYSDGIVSDVSVDGSTTCRSRSGSAYSSGCTAMDHRNHRAAAAVGSTSTNHAVCTAAAAQHRAHVPPPTPGTAFVEDLAERRKRLIQQTWKLVEDGLDVDATRRFYKRLFEKYPDVEEVFGGVDMEMQSQKLYEVLRVAIRFLDNIDGLMPTLREMGVRHARAYNVKRSQYNAVTEVFIETLNEYLGEALRPVFKESTAIVQLDVAAAWGWVLTLIGTTMADAGEAAVGSTFAK